MSLYQKGNAEEGNGAKSAVVKIKGHFEVPKEEFLISCIAPKEVSFLEPRREIPVFTQ